MEDLSQKPTTQRLKVAGYIYVITNAVNGKEYVGQTKSIQARWKKHLSDSRHGSPLAIHNAIRKYGEEKFVIECVEAVYGARADLMQAEIQHIAARGSMSPNGYNLTPGGEGVNYSVPEVRERASQAAKRRFEDPAYRGRHLEIVRGLASDLEWIAACVAGAKARSSKPEWRDNQFEGARKRMGSPEWQKNQVEGAKKRSEDTQWREACTDAVMTYWTPERREAQAEVMRRNLDDPEFLERRTKGDAKRAANMEWRQNVAKANRKRAEDPAWRGQNSRFLKELAEDPKWRELNADNNRQLAQDPGWKAKLVKGIAARSADPEWRKNQAEGARKRAQDPNFKAKQAEARRLANEIRAAQARARDALLPPNEAARRAKRREASRLRMARKALEAKDLV